MIHFAILTAGEDGLILLSVCSLNLRCILQSVALMYLKISIKSDYIYQVHCPNIGQTYPGGLL